MPFLETLLDERNSFQILKVGNWVLMRDHKTGKGEWWYEHDHEARTLLVRRLARERREKHGPSA